MVRRRIVVGLAFLWTMVMAPLVRGELFDSLDAYPPRWQLDTSDCDARVIDHGNLANAGVDGGGCEAITFHAGLGSESILVYPIEPVHAMNDLVANLALMSARKGARVGVRVRFPYLRDEQTRRPVAVVIYGAAYENAGKYQTLGIGSIERELKIKTAKLLAIHGVDANLKDPYVDAIAINAYSGPGTTTLRLDQVSVRGMIPVGDHGRVAAVDGSGESLLTAPPQRMLQMRVAPNTSLPSLPSRDSSPPFPADALIRILEHRGEPLSWVRSLGFDAVLLPQFPSAELLRDAIQTQMLVYAPPPVAPDPSLGTLLDPVAAWYLGGGIALDGERVDQTDKTVRRLRALPVQWRRPIVIAPVEDWGHYASIADGIVSDAPLRYRGLQASEQAIVHQARLAKIGSGSGFAIAIESSSPDKLSSMNQAIENTIGAPPTANIHWHSMLTQVVQSLEHSPRAIVFRSPDSLVSGSVFAHQRSMALSYTNRFIAMISPWIATARPATPYRVAGAPYRCGRLDVGADQFLLLTSDQSIREHVLAGDGSSIEVQLPPEMAQRTAWRITNFAAQRIDIRPTPSGAAIEIVSPDVAEMIVISSDASLGTRLDQSARRHAARAATDRWQLSNDQIRQIRQDWDLAVASGATEAIMPIELLTAAQRTIEDAEAAFRARDAETTLHLSRRADAWSIRAGVQLAQALIPAADRTGSPAFVSCPPIDEGRANLQIAWHPLMGDAGWSRNLIASGGMDHPDILGDQGWSFGQRKLSRARSDARYINRGYFSGQGAIELSAAATTNEPLAGGYEGTIAILSSPSVKIPSGTAVRIDAMVRTIGFGAPHQGILVYDSVGGQEIGLLVRGASDWTPVRLYRHVSNEADLQVLFEVIGDGEAAIDEVSVRSWDPEPLPPLPFRSITP